MLAINIHFEGRLYDGHRWLLYFMGFTSENDGKVSAETRPLTSIALAFNLSFAPSCIIYVLCTVGAIAFRKIYIFLFLFFTSFFLPPLFIRSAAWRVIVVAYDVLRGSGRNSRVCGWLTDATNGKCILLSSGYPDASL